MKRLKEIFKDLFRPNEKPKYRFIIVDGRRSPEMILLKRRYINDFHPSVEKIDNSNTLIVNLNWESTVERLKEKNFEYDHSTTQVIYDDNYIDGINGIIHIIR